jgi:DNA-binding response OmpR family regulator
VLDVDRYSSAGLRWLLASDGGARPSSRCLLLQGSSTACADATAVGALGATVLLKPVATAPFVQAVLNTLKQAQANPAPTGPALRWPDLRVDREMPVVEARRGDRWQLLHLAPTQHRLLIALLEGEGRVLPRAGLQAQVWLDQPLGTRTIDQAVRRLRAVLAGVGLQSLVQTVRNGGYRCDLTALAGKPPLGKATERKPRAQEASLRVNAP